MARTDSIISCVSEIVAAQLLHNSVPSEEIPALIRSVYAAVSEIDDLAQDRPAATSGRATQGQKTPLLALSIDDTIRHDYIICLEDGKRLRMLKRYLMSHYGLTPEAYREKWGLPDDYPMNAPAVAEQRRDAAQKLGLGKPARQRRDTSDQS